jgi:drug/metabolite transporter (DMT)-like permease
MNQNSFFTLLALVATIVMWSSGFIGIRIGMQDYQAGSFALLRLGVAAVCMLILYLLSPPKQTIALRDKLFAMMLGAIGMGVYHAFLNLGEQTVTAGIASFITAQAPVLATLFAVAFLGERVPRLGWLGLLIGVGGVILIALGEIENATFDFGVVYILISTCSFCVYITQAKQLLARMKSIHLTVFVVWGGALSCLIFLPQLIHDLPRASVSATIAALYLGIFSSALAFLTYNYVLAKISRSAAASILYAIPLTTSLMGWLWLNEEPTTFAFCGGIMALAGASEI